MSKIDQEDVRKVAALAQLAPDQAEIARMQRDLESILEYVDALAELDVGDVPPMTHPLELRAPLREDRVSGVLSVEDALRCAPEHADGALVVPAVIE